MLGHRRLAVEFDLYTSVLVVITFLSVAVLASLALKALHFPYTIGLMVIGLGLGGLLWGVPELSGFRLLVLSPEVILYLVLPTLIFEASMNIDARLLFRNLVPIVLLAVVGLLISTVVVAFGLAGVTSLPLAGALLFGALISATDPVAVIALFKEIGAPRRLVTLIDGESLFNDATAIVLFTVIAGAVGMSGAHAADPSLWGGAVRFTVVLMGGLAVGGAIGWAGSYLIQVDRGNFLFQIAVSLIMAYLSFLVADHVFHFSGVMSSLAAGLMLRYRAETAFRRHHIHTLEQVWELLSFVANSFVFILLGLTAFSSVVHQGDILKSLGPVLWSLPIVLVARFLSIFLLLPPYNWFLKFQKKSPIPWNYQAILFWGGLRGAVPVALVLAIPATFPDRDLIVHLTFGIILFTLLVQGTTVKRVMAWLGVHPDGSPFADRPTVKRQFKLPDERLASLVQNQVQRTFEGEGFLVELGEKDEALSLRKGTQMFTLERQGSGLVAECEPQDTEYLATVVHESLLFLRSAVGSIQEVTASSVPAFSAESTEPIDYPLLRALQPANIVLHLKPGTKSEVIEALVRRLAENGDVKDPTRVLADILEREASMTTGLGKGIATPHAKTDEVDHLVLAFGICPEGTDFAAFDGQPSRYFSLILSPKGEEGPHLKVLSMVTGLLNRQALRAGLDTATTAEGVYQLIRSHASRWWSPAGS